MDFQRFISVLTDLLKEIHEVIERFKLPIEFKNRMNLDDFIDNFYDQHLIKLKSDFTLLGNFLYDYNISHNYHFIRIYYSNQRKIKISYKLAPQYCVNFPIKDHEMITLDF